MRKPPVPAVVRLSGVRKSFGDYVALTGIDLEIGAGEFFTLLGPSGSGKTTTLRLIAGFEAPDAGRIELDGQDVAYLPPHARDVNTVFQDYALFPHMSVLLNVAYGLEARGMTRRAALPLAGEALRMVQLEAMAARRPGQLSGGQRQRVALARAIVNRPKLLLLDEPLGALDLKLRQEMQVELKRIQRDVGLTFLYVTHDQEEALTMSDRIAVFDHGRIAQIGTPVEIYERPRTAYVAGFVGLSNMLERGGRRVALRPEKIALLGAGEAAGSARVAEAGRRPGGRLCRLGHALHGDARRRHAAHRGRAERRPRAAWPALRRGAERGRGVAAGKHVRDRGRLNREGGG